MNGVALSQRLPALRHPAYRNYFLGAFISNVGSMVQFWAIIGHVYDISKSSFMVGMLGLIRVGPLLVFSLFGGVIADQFDRRKVMMITQSAMAVIAIALAVLDFTQVISVAAIYSLMLLASVARAFDGPTRQAMVAGLVPTNDLPNALSLNGVSWRASDVIGPVLAGLLIATGGIGPLSGFGLCYVFNFATFFAVLFVLLKIPSPKAVTEERIRTFRQVIAFIREGVHFIRDARIVRSAMLIDFWATFFSAADALLPAFAVKYLAMGSGGYTILGTAIAVGALSAALFMTLRPTIREQGRWVIYMVAAYGLCTVGFGLSNSVWLAMLFLAGTGAADMVSTILRQTIRQLATPDHMRGRMSATGMLFQVTGPQLGDFEAGAVAKFTGERASVLIGGLACSIIAGNWLARPGLRDYHHDPEPLEESLSAPGADPEQAETGS